MTQKKTAVKSTAKEKCFVSTVVETMKNRYSDEELLEFKQLILEKLVKAYRDLKLLNEASSGNDHDTNDTSPTFKVLEEGYQSFSKEENGLFASRQEKFIVCLEKALVRIENKTYGICCKTGKLIPKDRLKSVLHTTQCLEAKLMEPPKKIQPPRMVSGREPRYPRF